MEIDLSRAKKIPQGIDLSRAKKVKLETVPAEPKTNEFENFAAGTMRGLMSFPRTAGKYLSKGVQTLGNDVAKESGESNWMQGAGYTDEDIAEQERLDKPLMDTTGGMVGNLVGEAAMTAVPTGSMYNAGRAIYQGTRLLPKILASGASGAVSGAAGSLMTGYDDPEELGVAALAGGVLAPAAHVVGKGASWLRKVYENNPIFADNIVTAYLQNLAGNNASGVVRALRNVADGSEIGERLTAGRAALADDGAYPWLKVLDQDVTLGRQAGQSAQIEQANRNIRADILRRQAHPGQQGIDPVTGRATPSYYQRDIADVKRNYYDPSMADPVVMSPDLEAQISGSLITPADRAAGKIVNQRNLLGQGTPGVTQQGGQLGVDPVTNQLTSTLPIKSVRDLQTLKRALTGTAKRAELEGYGGEIPIRDTRAAVVDRMRTASPMFADAEDHFAGLSRIQNQAEYADDLLKKLNPIDGGKQTYDSFLARVRDPDSFLKGNKLDGIYESPEHLFANAPMRLEEINALRRAVEREVKFNQIPSHKGLTDELLSGATQAERMSPPLFTPAVTTGKRILRALGSRQEQRAFDMLDNLVLNPAQMADVIESIPVSQRSAVVNFLRENARRRGNKQIGGAIGIIGQQIGENYAP